MNKGKATCAYLKEVRRRVAAENGIDLEIPECHFEGECSGTCPRCESEVRYLEGELRKRGKMGRVLATAGIAAGMSLMASCQVNGYLEPATGDDTLPPDSIGTQQNAAVDEEDTVELLGIVEADRVPVPPQPEDGEK